jgi:glutamyl/glutaminyl-tRNA synthetase
MKIIYSKTKNTPKRTRFTSKTNDEYEKLLADLIERGRLLRDFEAQERRREFKVIYPQNKKS